MTVLKELFKDKIKNNKINPNTLRSVLLKNQWIYDTYYEDFKINEDLYKTFLKYILSLIFDIKLKKCIVCGKKLTYNQSISNGKFCSNKCKLSKEGNPFTWESTKRKIKETCLEKYNVTNPSKSNLIKQKIKETCLKKYNVDNVSKLDEIKNKISLTNLKLGKEIANKSKNTNIKKYGVKHKNILNAWNKIINLKNAEPMFTVYDYENSNHEKDFLQFKCKFCGNIFYSRYDNGTLISKCKCQRANAGVNGSKYEKEISKFLKSLNINFEIHFKFNNHQEVDFLIKDFNLALEFNGSYWHSIKNNHGNGYHLNKVIECNNLGYRLIHIWEDEWINNKEEIKNKLKLIFEGKEIIDYSKSLDRSWYNNLEGDFEILSPEIIIRNGFEVENCGYLKK